MTTETYELLCLLLQTWRRPSFAPSCHWAVYGHYADEPVPGAMVLAVSSRLPMDFEMPKTMAAPLFDLAANPGASGPLTARTAELPKVKLRSLLRAGRTIAIPVNVVVPGFGAPEGTTVQAVREGEDAVVRGHLAVHRDHVERPLHRAA